MQQLRYLMVVGLIVLVGCGPSGDNDNDNGNGSHMLGQSQQQLEEARKRAEELTEAASRRAEQVENVGQ